jgi:hypothetical protein
MSTKRRSKAQIVQSLLRPAQRPSQAGTTRSAAVRRIHKLGLGAREQVRANAARAYRRAKLNPLVGPLPVGIGAALGVGGAMALAGIEILAIVIAVPLACLLAYGVTDGTVTTAARRRAREEIDLAAAFDRVVEGAAREIPESTLDRLRQIKALLVRLLADMPNLRDSGALGGDDVFFVRQAIARYVPDALGPYLALSIEGRMRKSDSGDDPERLLNEQLELLMHKLASLAKRADEAQLETLRRNRTFLDRKVG